MADKARRALTEGEKAFADEAFRGRIKFDRVGIRHGSGGNPAAAVALTSAQAVTLINTIYFRGDPVGDYSQSGYKLLFLHEMTHIWQYQMLGAPRFYMRYARELAARRFNRHAMYDYKQGDPFDKAMLEAQADMVRDYRGGAAARAKAGPSLAATGLYGL